MQLQSQGRASARFHKAVFKDGLANLMTGSGTTVDRRKSNMWLQNILDQTSIEDAYRGSWLMRKIIDLPAYDMTRAWRDWQASDDQIELLEAEEARLHVQERIMQGIILGRLGGGIVVMGFADEPANELNIEGLDKGALQYLYPVHRSRIKIGEPVTDPTSPQFGQPENFEITIGTKQVVVHHTRCIVFKGLFSGNLSAAGGNVSDFWGDSVVAATSEPVENATSVQNEFAALIAEAKVDVYRMPDLMLNAANADYEKRWNRRFELANMAKSVHRALIMDKEEEWEQRQLTLSGMAELATTFMAIVAGAADIPATRLLNKSPDGMNATGESDQDNYNQMIRTKQDNDLSPKLKQLDEALIPSALGSRPKEIYFEFAPLTVLSEQAAAEVENKEADTLTKLVTTGLFMDDALEEAFSNRMVESGRWPGYEKAREDALAAAEEEPTEADVAGVTNPPPPIPATGVVVQPGTQPAPQPASS